MLLFLSHTHIHKSLHPSPLFIAIVLRGPSKDIINEVERNLQDAMSVARNVMNEPCLCPGGGASEMALSVKLTEKGKSIGGVEQWPYRALAESFEVIPRTLVQNCGGKAIRTLTQLKVRRREACGLFVVVFWSF